MQYLCSGPLICHCRTSRCSGNAVVHYSTTSTSFKYFGHTILILFHHCQATDSALHSHFLILLSGAVSLQWALESHWIITGIPLYSILFEHWDSTSDTHFFPTASTLNYHCIFSRVPLGRTFFLDTRDQGLHRASQVNRQASAFIAKIWPPKQIYFFHSYILI